MLTRPKSTVRVQRSAHARWPLLGPEFQIPKSSPRMCEADSVLNFQQRRSQEFDLGGYKWVKETKQPQKMKVD